MPERDPYERLADDVEALWKRERYEVAALTRVATLALRARPLPPVSSGEVLVRRERFAVQGDVTLASTLVHSHDHVGAFRVLRGRSLHATYRFEVEGATLPLAPLTRGALRCALLEELGEGDVRPIDATPHALMHLEPDACSVHVTSGPILPAARVFFPGLAVGATVQRARIEALAGEVGLDEEWAAALAEEAWRENVHAWRDELTSPAHRFFLALLLLAPNRAAIFERVRARYGPRPVERVLRWMNELAVRQPDGGMDLLGIAIPPDLARSFTPAMRSRLAGRKPRDARWLALDQSFLRNLFIWKSRKETNDEKEIECR